MRQWAREQQQVQQAATAELICQSDRSSFSSPRLSLTQCGPPPPPLGETPWGNTMGAGILDCENFSRRVQPD